MPTLRDGTVIPSYLSIQGMGEAQDTGNFSNVTLRLGEVKARIAPTDTKSLTKRYIEYVVEVQHRDGSGPASSSIYSNCLVASMFGSGGDKCRYTLRVDTGGAGEDGLGVGSKVLMLCLNGENARTYIIGGIRDVVNDVVKDAVADGHNYFWEFNGLRQTVDADGQFKTVFRGATKPDGTNLSSVNKNSIGTTLSFAKDGSVSLFAGGDGTERSSGAAGKLRLALDAPGRDASLVSPGTASIQAGDNIDIRTNLGDIILTPDQGKTKIGSSQAEQALVLGTDFRSEQMSMHNKMVAALTAMSTVITQLATAHNVTGTALTSAGSAMLAGPTGNIVAAPFVTAASVQILAMGISLQALNQAVNQLKSAINSFESSTDKYLSEHHFSQK